MQLLPADQLGVHIDPTGLRFGILLPGVSIASGCTVEVRIIHAEDQFLEDVSPNSFALNHGSLAP
jgi:hypothetical protein